MSIQHSDGKERNTKFFVIAAVYDKPARADILNLISCNGFYGCLKCKEKGATFYTDKGN